MQTEDSHLRAPKTSKCWSSIKELGWPARNLAQFGYCSHRRTCRVLTSMCDLRVKVWDACNGVLRHRFEPEVLPTSPSHKPHTWVFPLRANWYHLKEGGEVQQKLPVHIRMYLNDFLRNLSSALVLWFISKIHRLRRVPLMYGVHRNLERPERLEDRWLKWLWT